MKLLVVDSNPAAENDRLRPWYGASLGAGFAADLLEIDATLEIDVTAPYDGDPAPDMHVYDGVVFTGSSVSWSTSDTRAAPLARAMEAAFNAARPVYGSCNGLQLAASVLGGTVGASPNGREDGLAEDVTLTSAGLEHLFMADRKPSFHVGCVHRDEVQNLPSGAVLMAGNAHSPAQAFVYESQGIRFWGCQYHPEYSPTYLGAYLRNTNRQAAAERMTEVLSDREDLSPAIRRTELRNWLASLTRS